MKIRWSFSYGIVMLVLLLIALHAGPLQADTIKDLKISLSMSNVPVRTVLNELERRSSFTFFYSNEEVNTSRRVNIHLSNATLIEALQHLFRDTDVSYRFRGRQIILEARPVPSRLLKKRPALHKEEGRDNTSTASSFLTRRMARLVPISLQTSVSGTVRDAETKEVLPGVSVQLAGTDLGTVTDENGIYKLQISGLPVQNTLVFSFLGYVTAEIPIEGRQQIDMELSRDVTGLEEVVVVGYGTQRKVNLTGAVSAVSGDDLTRRQVGQTTAALQGMAPGVTVAQRSGQPGRDGGVVRIRGVGTMSDPNPLVILDGVESSLNNVDPQEIESITILKDAASAAIYGARAANGVILITTKRGSAKGFSLTYNTYTGWQQPTDMPDIVNALDHMEMMNEAYTNTGRSPLYPEAFLEEYRTQGPSNRDRYPDTDWQELTLKDNAFMHSHYIGINGGTERIRVLGSLSYLDQYGIIPNTSFRRYNIRVNSDMELSDKFSTALDIFLRRTDLKEPSSGTGYVFHWMRRIPSNQAGLLSNGLYGEGWNGDHPLARAKDGGIRNEETLSAILNLNLKYRPASWLTAELNYAPKFNEPHVTSFTNIIQTYRWDSSPSYAVPGRNSLTEQFTRDWYNNLRATVTYDQLLNGVHHVTVLAGLQQEDQENNYISAYREVFQLPDYQEINAGNEENQQTTGSGEHWALRSFFGRINYNFREKYLLELNGRYDGSSRFASGNKYAFFPSVSAGWRISQEPFMEGLGDVVTDLKLRASWGRLGNQNIGLYPFAAFVDIGGSNYVFGGQEVTGAALNDMANPDIRWESTEVTDIGLDLNLWSKFSLTADYYYRRTSGILLTLDIPTMLGLTAPFQNAGVVENKGWDVAAEYRSRFGQLDFGVTMTLSDVKNKVLDMRGIQRSGRQVSREGHPINAFYGYEAIGLFQDEADVENHATQIGNVAAGDIKYRDMNNDGVINTQDQTIIGSDIPRYTYSMGLDLGYRGLELSVFLQGVGKADGFLFGQGIMPFFLGGTVQEQHKDRWTPENPDAAFPRFAFNETNNEQNSTFWMRSAAYLRLKNLQLAYNFPASLLNGKVQRLRLYLSGQNLFTVDDFWQGYDAEAPASDGGWYPQMKSYSLGLDVTF